jgi:hypothetical protein
MGVQYGDSCLITSTLTIAYWLVRLATTDLQLRHSRIDDSISSSTIERLRRPTLLFSLDPIRQIRLINTPKIMLTHMAFMALYGVQAR